MPPEQPAGTVPPTLRRQQDQLSAYIRDPAGAPPPPGIEERRLRIYRELFFDNVSGMLAGNFPVICRVLGADAWRALVRDFYRDHASATPLFTELAQEFIDYLQGRDVATDPGWLHELAHYEWVELALQISDADPAPPTQAADDELLSGCPLLSPLAWPLAYTWPVHRIGPGFLPQEPPPQATVLLVHRQAGGRIRFHELSPLAFRLLQRLDEAPELTGREHLDRLALEAGREDAGAFRAEGVAMLRHWQDGGVVSCRQAGLSAP